MSGKVRSKQRVESFLNELEQGIASLTDEEFARVERLIVERRGRAAAHVVVAPIDTAQSCNPRSCSEISFDVAVVYLTLTDPLRIQPWLQDRRNQTKSNRKYFRR